MSDTVKLIIEIPKELYESKKGYLTNMDAYMICKAVQNGTPLDNNSERAEVQAYFAGKAYGWEQATAEIRAEIELLKVDGLANMDAVLNVIDRYFSQR